MNSASRYISGKYKIQRWSRNAVLKKKRLQIERGLLSPQEKPASQIPKPKLARFDLRINLERKDGERIQFTCHRIGDSIYHNGKLVAPKAFFRKIGEIMELWSKD